MNCHHWSGVRFRKAGFLAEAVGDLEKAAGSSCIQPNSGEIYRIIRRFSPGLLWRLAEKTLPQNTLSGLPVRIKKKENVLKGACFRCLLYQDQPR
jgi:hypothetical protein